MITITALSGETLLLYSSIKEMPIKLHNMAQRYLLQDMGIGSDMGAIDERFRSMDAYLAAGKLEEAKLERENLRFGFYTILQEVSYKALAFGCHIFSINDKRVEDRSEEGLTALLEPLEISMQDVEGTLSELKKNFNTN